MDGPRDALDRLMAGNQRWVGGAARTIDLAVHRRALLTEGQWPFAVTLSCVDSRVPPEMVFDCGLGELVVVRSAGHTLDDIVLGSVEFGPLELSTPLIFVLGHQRCGAATLAVEAFGNDTWPPAHLEDVVEALRPASKVAGQQRGPDIVDQVARAHTALTVARLRAHPVFAESQKAGRLGIVGGYYHLDTGAVEIVA